MRSHSTRSRSDHAPLFPAHQLSESKYRLTHPPSFSGTQFELNMLIEMGFSVVAIAARMGHKSTDIALNYAHLFPGEQNEMADALQAIDAERNLDS